MLNQFTAQHRFNVKAKNKAELTVAIDADSRSSRLHSGPDPVQIIDSHNKTIKYKSYT